MSKIDYLHHDTVTKTEGKRINFDKRIDAEIEKNYSEGYERGYGQGCADSRMSAFKEGYAKGKKDAAPKWTPISEGLPEENKEVLVTAVFSDGQKEVGTLSLNKGKWTNGYFSYDDVVTAWMPNPKPYEEEEERR